ncbi:MAG: DUF3822 family protein [Bacteroidales bacterium]|nr:DUF3822 family protein [Bacteroidales bacterium]
MAFNELFDETLDINSTANYILSIQANLDGFYFVVTDTLRNKHVLFRAYEPDDDQRFTAAKIESICRDDDFLTRTYSATYLSIPSPGSTLVPSSLYDPSGRDDYFKLNITPAENEVIKVNKLRYPDAYLIFSVDGELSSLLASIFPGCEPMHHLKPLLHHLLTTRESQTENVLHLHVEKDFINVIHIAESSVKLCNTFTYKSISDLMYYVLYIARKAGLSSPAPLFVTGATVRFDEIWTGLSEYISQIRYSRPSGKTLFSYVFNEEIQHRHLNLFNLANCVL